MLRLKSIQVRRLEYGIFQAVPQFYGPKGSFITRADLKQVGDTAGLAVEALLLTIDALQDRGE